jgi:para-nitrobenzyl esterase
MKHLLLLISAACAASAASFEPIQVDGGLIAGIPSPQWSYGIRVFRGVPFAAPPVGNLRWRSPQPVVPWQGVKEADRYSPVCMQPATAKDSNGWMDGLTPVSEDCLYLNIWTPAKSANDNLAVMVFIPGGGNTRGAASELQYDGNNLAKKGVVYVNINYRLGIFGFLAHPDLTKESEHHASGNYALQDQIAALRWIQRNIAKFGGNPNNVMVFGHSAGASNLASLMASPLAKGLFHRALAQSGGLGNQPPLAQAEEAGVKFAESLGVHSIAQLRAKSADEILNARRILNGPVVDGWVLPEGVYSIFAAGKQNDVPLIAGSVGDDGPGAGMPAKAAEVPAWAKDNYGSLADEFMKVFPAKSDTETAKSSHDLRRDRSLVGARDWLSVQSQTGKSKAYWYLFNHASPMPPGAMFSGRPATDMGSYHGGELVYVWNNLYLKDWPWTPADHSLGELMSSLWTNFAKTGDPNGPGLPKWPSYESKNEMLLYITTEAKAQAPPYKPELDFLSKAAAAARKR